MAISTPAAPAARVLSTPTQAQLAAGLLLLAIANLAASHVRGALATQSLGDALMNGLGASWAFWVALALAVRLALTAPSRPASRLELVLAGVALVMIASPVRQLSALVATGMALWLIFRPGFDPKLRAAGIVLLALTVHLVWTTLLMLMFARPIEAIDAQLVGWVTGVPVRHNMVGFTDGQQGFLVMGGCTSVQNASMALLLWIALARSARPEPRPRDLLIGLGLFVTVAAINIGRLSLIAQSRDMLNLVHGATGSSLTIGLITAAALAWTVFDVRRELFH